MINSNKTMELAWVKQGTIKWEGWYTKNHGRNLKKIGDLKNHVSFANFDLQNNNCPTIELREDSIQIHDAPSYKLPIIKEIIEYHGFKILSS